MWLIYVLEVDSRTTVDSHLCPQSHPSLLLGQQRVNGVTGELPVLVGRDTVLLRGPL